MNCMVKVNESKSEWFRVVVGFIKSYFASSPLIAKFLYSIEPEDLIVDQRGSDRAQKTCYLKSIKNTYWALKTLHSILTFEEEI